MTMNAIESRLPESLDDLDGVTVVRSGGPVPRSCRRKLTAWRTWTSTRTTVLRSEGCPQPRASCRTHPHPHFEPAPSSQLTAVWSSTISRSALESRPLPRTALGHSRRHRPTRLASTVGSQTPTPMSVTNCTQAASVIRLTTSQSATAETMHTTVTALRSRA